MLAAIPRQDGLNTMSLWLDLKLKALWWPPIPNRVFWLVGLVFFLKSINYIKSSRTLPWIAMVSNVRDKNKIGKKYIHRDLLYRFDSQTSQTSALQMTKGSPWCCCPLWSFAQLQGHAPARPLLLGAALGTRRWDTEQSERNKHSVHAP